MNKLLAAKLTDKWFREKRLPARIKYYTSNDPNAIFTFIFSYTNEYKFYYAYKSNYIGQTKFENAQHTFLGPEVELKQVMNEVWLDLTNDEKTAIMCEILAKNDKL